MTSHSSSESDLIAVRRAKADKLRAMGIDPFGGLNANGFRASYQMHDLQCNDTFASIVENQARVRIAGRVSAIRNMGKTRFVKLSDAHGDFQGFIDTTALTDEEKALWACIDLGDWIGLQGELFRTKTSEKTVRVDKTTFLTKSLRPVPTEWSGIVDAETKYRKRHLDLISNRNQVFLDRSRILRDIRGYLHSEGFIEVETPMLHNMAGGASATPFTTHHEALDIPLSLRIAPELFLKRLLVGGMTRVFEMNRNFRNEGLSRKHNPEFTALEVYQAFADFEKMAKLVESMVSSLIQKRENRDPYYTFPKGINMTRPWRRARFQDLVRTAAGPDFFDLDASERRTRCTALNVVVTEDMSDSDVIQKVFERLVEPTLIDPCFVTHIPADIVPLAKPSPNGTTAEAFELIINGQEIAPGYTELNDPDVQRARFEAQAKANGQEIDEDFLEALEYGMPPAGGVGIGIDRLVMLLTGAESIKDVILFPLQRPK